MMAARRKPTLRGEQRDKYPLDAALMARVCRELASDLRSEAAMDWPDIPLSSAGKACFITRAEAAVSMDAQAARWELEAAGGPLNVIDRVKIGY